MQAVSDYSHTFTLQGIDVLDANGDPMPGVRVVVPDGNGGTNDVFLTIAEAEELESSSTTTTTTGAITTTTAAGTSTTDRRLHDVDHHTVLRHRRPRRPPAAAAVFVRSSAATASRCAARSARA